MHLCYIFEVRVGFYLDKTYYPGQWIKPGVTAVNTVLTFYCLLVCGTVTAITKTTIITQIYMSIYIHKIPS